MQAHRNEVTTRLDQSLQAIEQTLRTGLTTIETKQTAWFQSTMTHLDTTVESKYNAHKVFGFTEMEECEFFFFFSFCSHSSSSRQLRWRQR